MNIFRQHKLFCRYAGVSSRHFSQNKADTRRDFSRFLLLKFEQIFASRADLREFLGDVRPIYDDAVLSKMLYPSGKWVVEVSDSDALALSKKARMDPFGRLTVQYLTKAEVGELSTSKNHKIFRNALRLRTSGDITKPDVHYIFEDFGVSFDSIRKVFVSNDKFPDYIITFSNYNSALNAHKQKDGIIVGGHSISLTLYDI